MVGGINNNESSYVSQYGSANMQKLATKKMENDSVKFKNIKAKNESAGALAKGLATVAAVVVAIKNRGKIGTLVKKAWNGLKGLYPKAKSTLSKGAKIVSDGAKDILPKAKNKVSEGTKKAMDHVEKMHVKDTVTGTLRSIKNVLLKKS